jgi:2-oxoglutarate/2-oxoacid ferredoxin oxidoreductase subunit beta
MQYIIDEIINTPQVEAVNYTPKDFKADIDVRWCAGCGGFSILSQVQRILPDLGVPKEKMVFVSGIGCSSRFPYYMNVYGFHSIHGRALAVASGLKTARPDLSVWVATGDGDCMSIGGNHFIHACRRNMNLNVIMFNNEIYSLTKGQYSPTSRVGQKTKSSPFGVVDDAFNPTSLALGSGATFVARGFDKDTNLLKYFFERAAKHKGFSFVEIYTNCVIYNDGAFDKFMRRETRRESTVFVEHGKPLIFGEKNDKGIKMDGYRPTIVDLNDGIHSVNDLIVHDETDSTLAFIISNMSFDENYPRPYGVIQAIEKPTYDEKVDYQIEETIAKKGEGNLQDLLLGDEWWEIKPNGNQK